MSRTNKRNLKFKGRIRRGRGRNGKEERENNNDKEEGKEGKIEKG